MDTIQHVAKAASKAVWRPSSQDNDNTQENHQFHPNQPATTEEPLSGVTGDPAKGEPYDAGNQDEQDAANARSADGVAAGHSHSSSSNSGKNLDEDADRTACPNRRVSPGARRRRAQGNEPSGKSTNDRNTAATSAVADGKSDGPKSTSQSEGTGEAYVRSTGLRADGGDFDAALPGAGREADRLLDQKGVAHGGGDAAPGGGSNGSEESPSGNGKKHSVGQRIKAKIHPNSG